MRRARRVGSLAGEIERLLEEYGVPLPTTAVRVLLTDRGRPTSAEHLARVAASERDEFLRTRMPPRLCSVITPDAALAVPRWWAFGDWRLQRRILTEDALPLWHGHLAEQVASDLIVRRRPASRELADLVRSTFAQLDLAEELARLPDPSDWLAVRALLLDFLPGVTIAHDVSTHQQHAAEQALLAADIPSVDLYFGVSPHRGPA